MTLTLERLESRDHPSGVYHQPTSGGTYGVVPFNPRHAVIAGTQAKDVSQEGAATCVFLSRVAGAAQHGDVTHRLHHVSRYVWTVDLHDLNGRPVSVPVVFNGHYTPDDPDIVGGEFWPLLVQRAYLKLVPWALRGGDDYSDVGVIWDGKLPGYDGALGRIGTAGIKEALAFGKTVLLADADHSYWLCHFSGGVPVVFNPWGFYQKLPMRSVWEVAVL